MSEPSSSDVTRRDLLASASVAGFASLLALGTDARGDEQGPAAQDAAAPDKDHTFNLGEPLTERKVAQIYDRLRYFKTLVQCGIQQKNALWIQVDFPIKYDSAPVVIVQPYWAGQNAGVSHVETLDEISPTSFRVGSANRAANYYVCWIAIGQHDPDNAKKS